MMHEVVGIAVGVVFMVCLITIMIVSTIQTTRAIWKNFR